MRVPPMSDLGQMARSALKIEEDAAASLRLLPNAIPVKDGVLDKATMATQLESLDRAGLKVTGDGLSAKTVGDQTHYTIGDRVEFSISYHGPASNHPMLSRLLRGKATDMVVDHPNGSIAAVHLTNLTFPRGNGIYGVHVLGASKSVSMRFDKGFSAYVRTP